MQPSGAFIGNENTTTESGLVISGSCGMPFSIIKVVKGSFLSPRTVRI